MKEDAKTKLLTTIRERMESSDSFLKGYKENFNRYYAIYRAYMNPDEWPTKSKIFNPYIYGIIESEAAKSIAQKPSGEYVPDPNSDEAQGDPKIIGLWFDSCWRKDRATFRAQSAFKKGCMYGSVMTFVKWKFRKGTIAGKKKIVDDRPSFDLLRLEDGMCGFDPEPDEWGNVRWAWKADYLSKGDLEQMLDGPESETFDKKEIEEAIENFNTDDYGKNDFKNEKLSKQDTTSVSDSTIKKVRCIYMEDYESGKVTTTLGDKYVIRDVDNFLPFERSFTFYNNTIIPSEIMGMGDIEPTETLQHGINLTKNQRIDNVESILKNQWISDTNAGIDDDELVDELNGIIHVDGDVNKALKPLMKPNVTGSALQEEEGMKMDIQRALSISNASQGSDEVESDRSGKAIRALQSAADARIRNKLQLFEVMFIKDIAEKWQRLASMYQKDSIKIDDAGEAVVVKPEIFAGEFNYHVEAGSTKHTDIYEDRQDFNEYMDRIIMLADKKMASQMPQMGGMPQDPMNPLDQMSPPQPPMPTIDYDKLAEELSEKYGIKNWQEIWVQQQEQPTEQGEMLPQIGELAEREKGFGEGEMLPSIDMQDTTAQHTTAQPGEMLPSIN